MEVLRKCRDCDKEAHNESDLEDFCYNSHQKHNRDNLCKRCNAERASKRRNQKNYTKEKHLKNRYGITLNEYNLMFSEQKGCCKICGTHQSELKKSLAVDHCHTQGDVRGLLCQNCNTALGLFKDNIKALENAIEYLKED